MISLDARLSAQSELVSPSDRLETVLAYYEESAGVTVGRPPSPTEREQARDFLRRQSPTLMTKRPALRSLASLSATDKANWLVQAPCPVCDLIVNPDGSFVYDARIIIDVMPWTAQSRADKVALREAVASELSQRALPAVVKDLAMCVRVVSVVPDRSPQKDVDNIVKGVLDSLQSVVFVNDRQVQCLSSRVIPYSGTSGYYLIGARAVHRWHEDVVFNDPLPPQHLSGRPVRI